MGSGFGKPAETETEIRQPKSRHMGSSNRQLGLELDEVLFRCRSSRDSWIALQPLRVLQRLATMAQDPRALLQKANSINAHHHSSATTDLDSTGRQSCLFSWRRLLPLWRQDRKVRKRSRTLHPSSQRLPTPKSRQRSRTSLREGRSNSNQQSERTRRCRQYSHRSV